MKHKDIFQKNDATMAELLLELASYFSITTMSGIINHEGHADQQAEMVTLK